MKRRAKVALLLALLVALLAAGAVPAALWWRARPVVIAARGVSVLAFSPTGEHLLAGAPRSPLRVYSTWDGALVKEIEPVGEGARSISFHPDGVRVLTCSEAKDLNLRGWPGGEVIEKIATFCDSAIVSPRGDQIATIGANRVQVQRVRPEIGKLVEELKSGPPRSLTYSRTGDLLAFASDEKVAVYDMRTLKAVQSWFLDPLAAERAWCIAISPADDLLAVGGPSSIEFCGMWPKSDYRRTVETQHRVERLSFSPDGALLIFGANGEVASVSSWGRVSRDPRREGAPFRVLAISDTHAAGATEDEVVIWRVR